MINKEEGLKLLKEALFYAFKENISFDTTASFIAELCNKFGIPADSVRIDLTTDWYNNNLSLYQLAERSNVDQGKLVWLTEVLKINVELFQLNSALPTGPILNVSEIKKSEALPLVLSQDMAVIVDKQNLEKRLDWKLLRKKIDISSNLVTNQEEVLKLMQHMLTTAWKNDFSLNTIYQFLASACFRYGIKLENVKIVVGGNKIFTLLDFAIEQSDSIATMQLKSTRNKTVKIELCTTEIELAQCMERELPILRSQTSSPMSGSNMPTPMSVSTPSPSRQLGSMMLDSPVTKQGMQGMQGMPAENKAFRSLAQQFPPKPAQVTPAAVVNPVPTLAGKKRAGDEKKGQPNKKLAVTVGKSKTPRPQPVTQSDSTSSANLPSQSGSAFVFRPFQP